MNLMEQCNQWNQERQYKKIIDAIEAVPATARTNEQTLELARAYNNYGMESDSKYFIKTIEILKPLIPYMGDSPQYWLRYGFALFHSKYLPAALDCFLNALRLLSNNKKDEVLRISILKLTRMCLEQIFLLADTGFETFKTKVEKSWATISKISDRLYKTFSVEEVNKANAALMMHALDESFAFHKDFSLSFDKETKRIIIAFKTGCSKEDMYELCYFISKRPMDIFPEDKWHFTLDTKSVKEPKMRNQVFSIDSANVKVTLSYGARSTRFADIKLYAPNVTMYLSDPERGPVVVAALRGLVDFALGEICRMAYIDNVSIVTSEEELTTGDYNQEFGVFPLNKLHPKLQELGFKTDITADEYLAKSYLAYDFDGLTQRYQPMRFDVYIGSSSTNASIFEYYHFKNNILARMLLDGTVPGFFGFKLSDAVSDENYADEIFALRERCEQYFSERKESCPLHFTGGAQGERYCYIDFLNFNYGLDFLELAREFFDNDKLVSEAFYAPLCAGVSPIVLKGPEELALEFGDGLEQYVIGQNAATAD